MSMPLPTDDELLAAARTGDRDAVEALVVRHQPQVYRFALKTCADPESAKDVLQETLFALVRSVESFRGEAALSTWLYTVARNGCLRRRRRSKFAPVREESLDTLGAGQRDALVSPMRSPDQQLADQEQRDSLDAALDTLDPGQREVLVLRDIEGLTAAEVGTVLGLSVDAVKSRLHRARVALRRQLAPVPSPTPPDADAAPSRKPGLQTGPDPDTDPCRHMLELFSRHLEGDLSGNTCAEMEAHLAACDACRGRCASLRDVLALCRAAPAPALPPDVDQSVRKAIREYLTDPAGSSPP
jgi:RNA polymerase sigma-70 factor (ECF subfamily)